MNIECDAKTLEELEGIFRFNDAVIRTMTVKRKTAVTAASPLAKENESKPYNKHGSQDRRSAPAQDSDNADEKPDTNDTAAEKADADTGTDSDTTTAQA